MEINSSEKNKREQKRRAWALLLCILLPWLLGIKNGFNPVLLFASQTALFSAYLLGLTYYSLLSQLGLCLLPAFKEQWKSRNRGIGSLVALSALFAIVPAWTLPTAITQITGNPETAKVAVYEKSSGQFRRHACDYSLAVYPFEGRLTNICVSKVEWTKATVGKTLIVRGKRSWFGYVVSEVEPQL